MTALASSYRFKEKLMLLHSTDMALSIGAS